MKCMQPDVRLPVDFEGDHLNVMIGAEGRVWVCIDGESVFRAKNLKQVTVQDNRLRPGNKPTVNIEADAAEMIDRLGEPRIIWK